MGLTILFTEEIDIGICTLHRLRTSNLFMQTVSALKNDTHHIKVVHISPLKQLFTAWILWIKKSNRICLYDAVLVNSAPSFNLINISIIPKITLGFGKKRLASFCFFKQCVQTVNLCVHLTRRLVKTFVEVCVCSEFH